MAFNIPNQLPTGMSSFNQGFKGMGDFFDQIKQHQLKQQQLAELAKYHQAEMMFKKRADARSQNKESRAQQSFDQKNAVMNELAQWYKNKGKPGIPNNARIPTAVNNSKAAMYDPNTGILNGERNVGMNGESLNAQDDNMQSGLVARGNIDLSNRPMVKNPQGGISTVLTMGISEDGKHINIPRVSDDGRILNEKEAIDQFHKTGKHLGIFSSQDEADKAAQQLHEQQAKQYGLNSQQIPGQESGDENIPPQDLRERYELATGKPFPMPKESPEAKKRRELATNLEKLKQEYEMKKLEIKEKEIKTQRDVAPILKKKFDSLVEAYDIVENNPDIFGHSNEDRYMQVTTNPMAGYLTTELIPAILETERAASKQGGKVAIQFGKSKVPGVTSSQQASRGKVLAALNSAEKDYALSLKAGDVEGTTKAYKNGKQYNIPNGEVLDFLEHDKGAHLYAIK